MATFLNILGLFFMVSGIAAWAFGGFLVWYYWLCMPRKEE
jgi:hypothetical protein